MLDENLKHSEEKSRGFTKLPREFALLSAKWCYSQPPWHGQRFCRLGLWIDVTIFQVDLIWAVFCKKKKIRLDLLLILVATQLLLIWWDFFTWNAEWKANLTFHLSLITSKMENKEKCPGLWESFSCAHVPRILESDWDFMTPIYWLYLWQRHCEIR